MTEWEAATETEAAMRDALRAGDQELYFRMLARTDLLLPVSADALAGRAPMGWGTWTTGGRTHVLAFTSATSLQACLAESAGSFRRTAYTELAGAWPNPEWWLAVNPGLPIEGYLPAWFVSQLGRGDVRLPGRTRARMEQVERVARARATAAVPRRTPGGGPTLADRPLGPAGSFPPPAQPTHPLRAPDVPQPFRSAEVPQSLQAPEVPQSFRSAEVPQSLQAPEVPQPFRAPDVPPASVDPVPAAVANQATTVPVIAPRSAPGDRNGQQNPQAPGEATVGWMTPVRRTQPTEPTGAGNGVPTAPETALSSGLTAPVGPTNVTPAPVAAAEPPTPVEPVSRAGSAGSEADLPPAWYASPDPSRPAESPPTSTFAGSAEQTSDSTVDSGRSPDLSLFTPVPRRPAEDVSVDQPGQPWPGASSEQLTQAWPVGGAEQATPEWSVAGSEQLTQAWSVGVPEQASPTWSAAGSEQPTEAWTGGDAAAQPTEVWTTGDAAAQPTEAWTGGDAAAQPTEVWTTGGAERPAPARSVTGAEQLTRAAWATGSAEQATESWSGAGTAAPPTTAPETNGAAVPAPEADPTTATGPDTAALPDTGAGTPDPAPTRQLPVDFVPANDVERSLLDAAGGGSTDTFLSTLLLAKVLLPVAYTSATDSRPGDDGFEWRTEALDGETYVVVFTSPERLADHLPTSVQTVEVKFVQLIRRWPDEAWSFAVNPGTPVGAKLPGSEIVALANWAAEVGLGDDPDSAEPAPTAPAEEETPRSTYAPAREDPGRPTMMQKAIAPSQLAYYLDRGYDRVSGFVQRANEVAHLRTPTKLYAALGLGYPNSPFSRDADEVYVLRWPAHRPSLYRIPYGGQNEAAMRAMEGWVIERPPFRGNGFAPGESSDVVAEFKVDSVRLPHGAQLWRIGADGSERLVATLDCDQPLWRRTGED
ncbi:SseB family protein [Plantactinospora sonchi]|uniref:SseB family protein n=1 Tax=Plantactinospora sonchi TaxID=1544735 RepID=A0ABU7RYI6_9ACTN